MRLAKKDFLGHYGSAKTYSPIYEFAVGAAPVLFLRFNTKDDQERSSKATYGGDYGYCHAGGNQRVTLFNLESG
jgi:hypothetical protein